MGEIGEGLGLVAGIALGILLSRIDSPSLRRLFWVVASVALGAWVSWINGEWSVSPAFLLFDVPMVAGVSLGAALLIRRWSRRRPVF